MKLDPVAVRMSFNARMVSALILEKNVIVITTATIFLTRLTAKVTILTPISLLKNLISVVGSLFIDILIALNFTVL